MKDMPATPKEMKKVILGAIRGALLTMGSATKKELSGKLGISFPTIGKFLDAMEKEGELLFVGIDESSGGRRAKRFAYNPEYMLGLAVILEKEDTFYTVYNCQGEVKDQGRLPSALTEDMSALEERVDDILNAHPRIRSLSVGVPGSVNNGRIIYMPDYDRLQQFELKAYLESRFARPAVVENDMNAAALGYHSKLSGDGRESPVSLVYIYFGQNGPGAGILINGEVVRGSTFFSGEVSFIPQYEDLNFEQALRQAKGPDRSKLGESGVDAVGRLIATCAAIVNPHTVVFCDNEVDEALLTQIAARSAGYIPGEHLPSLVMSDWKRDYLNGLQHLGLSLMISTVGIDESIG